VSRLLVSVRSAAEAVAALEGGAALIDVKEPRRGPLGRAHDIAIAEVVAAVGGRCSVSAAMGEMSTTTALPRCLSELAYLKWGLAGWGWPQKDWRSALLLRASQVQARSACRLVAVAYADYRRAVSPDYNTVVSFAVARGAGAFLLDTFHKDGRTLLDHLDVATLEGLCTRCREMGMPIALAGSLGREQIRELLPLQPDWFAVRGAVCTRGQREGTIDPQRVRELVELVASG
jgi:uncharacterized protein (UPF0264 family)